LGQIAGNVGMSEKAKRKRHARALRPYASGAAIMSAIKSNLFGRSRIQNEEMPGLPLALRSKPNLSLSMFRGVSAAPWPSPPHLPSYTCLYRRRLGGRIFQRTHVASLPETLVANCHKRCPNELAKDPIKGRLSSDQVGPWAGVHARPAVIPPARRPARQRVLPGNFSRAAA
jgi:hypothetical protein